MSATNLVPVVTRRAEPWNRGLACLMALAGVAGCTWICFRFGANLSSVGFLYFVCIVVTAVYGGFWQATLISVVSVAALDYFFNEPLFSFSVDRVSDWVELGAFEFTALIVSRLSNRAQIRAQEAEAERRETARLYQTARQILLLDSGEDPDNSVSAMIRDVFELHNVVIFDVPSGKLYQSGVMAADSIVQRTKDAYLLDTSTFESTERTWFCVLRLGVRPVGSLALCGTQMGPLTATAIASLAAIVLERARMLQKQYHVEAARQAEQLRTAVLDALAHKFKTPLTVIRTASSGLAAAGSLSELQTELVSLIDQESLKLNDLASRLLETPKLDSAEFAPEPEPLLLSRLMKTAIQELEQPASRDRFHLSAPAHEAPVFADRELILTALAQLIDNALKYSLPDSLIEVRVAPNHSAAVLAIRTQGLVVAAADRERIFDRFYRAPGAHACAAGTGLGLSIVKTIAADHHGQVWAESEPGYGTTFSLSLPMFSGVRSGD